MNLSTHFTLDEFTRSKTAENLGIDNSASDEILDNLYQTAAGMERVRVVLGGAEVIINSGYRSKKLNSAVHGSKNSQHTRGEAADFVAPEFGTPLQVCKAIAAHKEFIGFDSLIFEGNWTHISFVDNGRSEILTAHFDNGSVTYSKGLV
jgi:zinc D-Ala-D-Ala carboxypeptidase